MVDNRSSSLGESARSPVVKADRDVPSGQRLSRTDLHTTNPAPGDLSFESADPARDVQQTLFEAYTEEAPVIDSVGLVLDLEGVLSLAQRSARELITAEEEYILAAIRLLIEQHRWGPRLSDELSAVISGDGDDGRFDTAVRVMNDLAVTQRLPYGGQVRASWIWDATEQLREQASGRYSQSSSLGLSASVPLLRGAGLAARESLTQTERSLVYGARTYERFRREFLVGISQDYFGLLESQARIANQQRQLDSRRRLLEITQAKVDAGRLRPFDLANVRNDVLSAEASLASLRNSYILQLERFKLRLGVPADEAMAIAPFTLTLPEPSVSRAQAAQWALDYRLDLQNRSDQLEDSRRGVALAADDLLPSLDFTGSVNVPTDPTVDEGGVSFDPRDAGWSAGITFGLPLDREIERLTLRQAQISLARAERDFERFRDNVMIDAWAAVRAVELARNQLNIAELQVQITESRREEQQIKIDTVTTQELLDTENALLNAYNARDSALTDLRVAVLNYLLTTGQMRVARDGTFEPIPGMNQPMEQ